MNLVTLSDEDFDEIETLFNQFHQEYTPFFQNRTKSVAPSAKDYLQGQLFIKQSQNMTQYCREVPESEYDAMQHFISDSPWDDKALIKQLQKDVCHLIGDEDQGALIVDESGIPKQGQMSVGVARQYCGRLGKVFASLTDAKGLRENCQVGVYLAYANSHQVSLVDYRLYLPFEWIADDNRRHLCGVPEEVEFQTKAELGLEMLQQFKASGLPFRWVNLDSHYGGQPWLLLALDQEEICYIADVPSDTRIFTHRPKRQFLKNKALVDVRQPKNGSSLKPNCQLRCGRSRKVWRSPTGLGFPFEKPNGAGSLPISSPIASACACRTQTGLAFG